MNSVLQAILNTALVKQYFNANLHQSHLNKKGSSSEGNVALSFGSLGKLYTTEKDREVIRPLQLKKVINKYIPVFYGHEQHDAQEVRETIPSSYPFSWRSSVKI